jgi:hypothetical protein
MASERPRNANGEHNPMLTGDTNDPAASSGSVGSTHSDL